MDYIEDFINKNTEDGKVALSRIYEFLETRFRIPIRTFQWYAKQGLLPKPNEQEWKTKYYTKEAALETLQKARIITKLKDYTGVDLSTIREIFKQYKNQAQAIIEELLNDIESYPAFYQEDQYADTLFDRKNNMIMKRICEDLANGIDLTKLNTLDIENDIKAKYNFQ